MKHYSLVVLVLLAALLIPGLEVKAAPRCFAEAPAVTACIDGRLQTFWEQHGGLPVFGYPLGPAFQDTNRPGAPLTQRFERTTLELHPENQPPYDVLLARMGADALAQAGRDWKALPKGNPVAPHFFKETGHAIAPQFWAFWSSHGLEIDGRPGTSLTESLALFGFPISEPQVESNAGGARVLTQWFERARFEWHPDKPDAFKVLLGLLGREIEGTQGPVAGAPAAAPLRPGEFITVAGSQLTRLGQPVQLKGVNYYPQGRPWKAMWYNWHAPQMARELRVARDQLGINAVRILLPYDTETDDDVRSRVADHLPKLRQLAQIAGDLDLRLIVTLFDFDDTWPQPGTPAARNRLEYVRLLLGNFAGDDRIIAWDLHNEPDHYPAWQAGKAQEVLGWLGRLADEVHRIAPNHLVTVGMGFYENLLQRGPDGRRVIDYSDFISVHSYNRGDIARQLDVLRANTAKPLVLGEFGWPTGNTCLARNYNEAEQELVYRDFLQAAKGRTAGVFAWTLRDYDIGPTQQWETRDDYYGLYRPDGSLKPAARHLQSYAAPPLPSVVDTDLPLTSNMKVGPKEEDASMPVAGSKYYVKRRFRHAWVHLGGQASFGLPISEAFAIARPKPHDAHVIQYFEAAALELYQTTLQVPFDELKPDEKAMLQARPLDLGVAYTAAKGIPTGGDKRIASAFQAFYDQHRGAWRLGKPITDAFVEDLGGVSTTVQYFEKGRLQRNPTTNVVEFGQLGRWAWETQCASAPVQ